MFPFNPGYFAFMFLPDIFTEPKLSFVITCWNVRYYNIIIYIIILYYNYMYFWLVIGRCYWLSWQELPYFSSQKRWKRRKEKISVVKKGMFWRCKHLSLLNSVTEVPLECKQLLNNNKLHCKNMAITLTKELGHLTFVSNAYNLRYISPFSAACV